MNSSDSESSSNDDEYGTKLDLVLKHQKMTANVMTATRLFGMYYCNPYLSKSERRQPDVTDYDWVMKCLSSHKACYKMFWVTRPIFDKLHETLVSNYGLSSTVHMTSTKSLGMFLWMLGGPQSVSQVEDRFQRSTETISRKFTQVLECLFNLEEHIIKPKDPQLIQIHHRLEDSPFSPYFNGCIGAIDGIHVPVIIPSIETVSHIGRYRYTS
jgi:hypothetical protein